jgi:hypothetical protein
MLDENCFRSALLAPAFSHFQTNVTMSHSILLGLLYAYPLSLYAARLLFPLILPRNGERTSKGTRLFKLIWYTQFILSMLSVSLSPCHGLPVEIEPCFLASDNGARSISIRGIITRP